MVLNMIDIEDSTEEIQKRVSVRITAIIPALNEGKNLPHVLPRLPEMIDEVILVDGHSTDNTIAVAKELRPDIRFVRQDGKGKGNALRCGFREATGDIIVMIDADGSMAPEEIPRFVEPLLEGYDFVKGSRFISGGGTSDMEWHRSLGNRMFVNMVNMLYRGTYTDLCYGYNAFWRHAIEDIDLTADGFEIETEMNLKVLKAGLRVAEVPSYEDARLNGGSNLSALRDGWRILKTILGNCLNRTENMAPIARQQEKSVV